MARPEAEQIKLAPRLSFKDAYFLVIGSVFGTGIFFTSGLMAADCPSPLPFLGIWILGGIFTLMGALTFAELGTMYPKAGGPYVYLREGYGRLAAFLYGWGFFWIVGCGGIAALGAGLAESFVAFGARWAAPTPWLQASLGSIRFSVSGGQLTAAAAVVAVSAVNRLGVRTGVRTQNALVVARVAGLVLFIGFGLAAALKAGFGPSSPAARLVRASGPLSLAGFGAAFLAVLWTYDGWYAASCTAEEIRNPRRVLPAALGLGVATLAALTSARRASTPRMMWGLPCPLTRALQARRTQARLMPASMPALWGRSTARQLVSWESPVRRSYTTCPGSWTAGTPTTRATAPFRTCSPEWPGWESSAFRQGRPRAPLLPAELTSTNTPTRRTCAGSRSPPPRARGASPATAAIRNSTWGRPSSSPWVPTALGARPSP